VRRRNITAHGEIGGKANDGILYQGHASLRITAPSGAVIYIDPFAGKGYDKPADLILVTHQHFDHNKTGKPAKKDGCVIWTHRDFLQDGQYLTKNLGDVTVRAVEAYNANHPKDECVGFVLTLGGTKLYVAGDTSTTSMMASLAQEELDCAFLPIDGKYNMDAREAAQCAELIKAKRVVPYHMVPAAPLGKLFDRKRAEAFRAENALILPAGETLRLD